MLRRNECRRPPDRHSAQSTEPVHRGTCRRIDTGQIHRHGHTRGRPFTAEPNVRHSHGPIDRCHRLPGTLPVAGLAASDEIGWRKSHLPRPGQDDVAARGRLDAVFDSGDPDLLDHYQTLAADCLDVLAGDKSAPDLGLDVPIGSGSPTLSMRSSTLLLWSTTCCPTHSFSDPMWPEPPSSSAWR